MFYEQFAKYAQELTSKTAIVEVNRTISYGELDTFINRIANNLLVLGMNSDSKISVSLENSIEFVALYFAVARIGATIIPLPPTLGEADVINFCYQSKSDYLIIEESTLSQYSSEFESRISSKLVYESSDVFTLHNVFNNSGSMLREMHVDPDRDFIIQYTKGNTGSAKGIIQSQRSHVKRLQLWISTANLTHTDRSLCLLSLTHAYGADQIAWPALLTGQTLFLLPTECTKPEQVAKLIDEEGITLFAHLPWFYTDLIRTTNSEWFSLSTLRIAICSGSPLPKAIADSYQQTFNLKINNSYGLNETSLLTTNLLSEGHEDYMSVGPVIDGVSFSIRECGSGIPNSGELLVKSDTFAVGYTNECDEELWQDGWIKTGDLVRQDENHCIHVLSRISEIIHTPSGSVFPFEIEEPLMNYKGIKEVAVTPLSGEGGIFVVVDNKYKIAESDIRNFVDSLSDRFRHIKHIKLINEFPKSIMGKISKSNLAV